VILKIQLLAFKCTKRGYIYLSYLPSIFAFTLSYFGQMRANEVCAMSCVEVNVSCDVSNTRKRRVLKDASVFDVLGVISGILSDTSAPRNWTPRVRVIDAPSLRGLTSKELVFTNICGKVTHHLAWHNKAVHVPEVMPWIVMDENDFGVCRKLSSPNSTLMTCMNSAVTRFCGGVSFEKTLEVVEIAIDRESVMSMTLHMVVANEHIGRPVHTSSPQIMRALASDTRWTTGVAHEHEDASFSTGFLLSQFDVCALGANAACALVHCPRIVRVSVSRRGKVNYFVALDNAPLKDNAVVSRDVLCVLGQIRAVILRCT
jgi:hypothetical protein